MSTYHVRNTFTGEKVSRMGLTYQDAKKQMEYAIIESASFGYGAKDFIIEEDS